ncbi:MAG: methyltransferase domain-containing protein [Vicinamibacterales bacterium]
MKNGEQNVWDLASEAWRNASSVDEPVEQQVNKRLVELAEIDGGFTVVDVATGIGNPALTASRHVGPTGCVIAIDQSAGMLAVAADRARKAGLTNIEFQQRDANAFDFSAGTIDAIVCRWGLMFLSDLVDALRRMRRSLKPGRCLAAATWSQPEKVPIISVRRSVLRAFDIPPGPNDPFRLSSAAPLKAAALSAGFDAADVTRSIVAYEYTSVQAFVDVQRAMHESRLTTLLQRPADQQSAFWHALGVAAEPYADTGGVVRMPSEILLLTARAPTETIIRG